MARAHLLDSLRPADRLMTPPREKRPNNAGVLRAIASADHGRGVAPPRGRRLSAPGTSPPQRRPHHSTPLAGASAKSVLPNAAGRRGPAGAAGRGGAPAPPRARPPAGLTLQPHPLARPAIPGAWHGLPRRRWGRHPCCQRRETWALLGLPSALARGERPGTCRPLGGHTDARPQWHSPRLTRPCARDTRLPAGPHEPPWPPPQPA